MEAFKVTSFNVEWLTNAFDVVRGVVPERSRRGQRRMPSMTDAQAKLQALRAEILEIDADILFLMEAVPGSADMTAFRDEYLPEYKLMTHPNGDDRTYGIQGEQWLWFLVKPALAQATRASLLDIATWKSYTADESKLSHNDGKWQFSAPQLDNREKTVGANVRRSHSHYRHPQILVMDYEGVRVEIIGAHFKSKHIGLSVPARRPEETDKAYHDRPDVAWFMANAHVARAKLSTEAMDVRYYIDKRFSQEELPIIMVIGDLNDGPGKELLEREYLLHDLISVLQGDVFFARKFLNHGLFDYPQHLRWTAIFEDKLDPGRSPNILLDHIVFTEALSRRGIGPLLVEPRSGFVEHEIHDRINSTQPANAKTSDHRPVSQIVARRPPIA